jgi:hypothetical protein
MAMAKELFIGIAGKKYIDRPTLSAILRVCPMTLARWTEEGLPCIAVGQARFYYLGDLTVWLMARKMTQKRRRQLEDLAAEIAEMMVSS